jgi:predicted N-formylglutamate amidohydrolase
LADSPSAAIRLLAADEAPSFVVENPGGASPLLLVGDHAGVAIPHALTGLGLPQGALDAHIAQDIGVAALGARLAVALDATFIRQRFSRLVIDCNRDPGRPDAICETSDGIAIPGNAALGAAARAARIAEVFAPYHDRIAAEIDARLAAGRPMRLVALHSFTPALSDGAPRPWRFGILHLGRSPFCDIMLARLREAVDLAEVGDNEPYAMDGTDYTVPRHAISRGFDYLELEVRQDLISDAAGLGAVADLLVPMLTEVAAGLG